MPTDTMSTWASTLPTRFPYPSSPSVELYCGLPGTMSIVVSTSGRCGYSRRRSDLVVVFVARRRVTPRCGRCPAERWSQRVSVSIGRFLVGETRARGPGRSLILYSPPTDANQPSLYAERQVRRRAMNRPPVTSILARGDSQTRLQLVHSAPASSVACGVICCRRPMVSISGRTTFTFTG